MQFLLFCIGLWHCVAAVLHSAMTNIVCFLRNAKLIEIKMPWNLRIDKQ